MEYNTTSCTQIRPKKRRICARTFSLLFEKVDARKSTFTGVKSIPANDKWFTDVIVEIPTFWRAYKVVSQCPDNELSGEAKLVLL